MSIKTTVIDMFIRFPFNKWYCLFMASCALSVMALTQSSLDFPIVGEEETFLYPSMFFQLV